MRRIFNFYIKSILLILTIGISALNVAQSRPLHAAGLGLESNVCTLAVSRNGDLYAGGLFTKAGGVVANNVARFDGSRWTPLGEGTDNGVTSLALTSNGNVYISGWLHEAGGVKAEGLAYWDGRKWHGISNDDMQVFEMVAAGDGMIYMIIAGMDNGMLRWDGKKLQKVGEQSADTAYLFVAQDGTLYAHCKLNEDGAYKYYIAQWNGSNWIPIAPSPATNYSIPSFAVSRDGKIYCKDPHCDIKERVSIKEWDGKSWKNLPILGQNFHSLTVTENGVLYAVKMRYIDKTSQFCTVVRWDGVKATELDKMTERRITTLAAGPNDSVYIGGVFSRLGNTPVNNIARWDGKTCTPLGSGIAF